VVHAARQLAVRGVEQMDHPIETDGGEPRRRDDARGEGDALMPRPQRTPGPTQVEVDLAAIARHDRVDLVGALA